MVGSRNWDVLGWDRAGERIGMDWDGWWNESGIRLSKIRWFEVGLVE